MIFFYLSDLLFYATQVWQMYDLLTQSTSKWCWHIQKWATCDTTHCLWQRENRQLPTGKWTSKNCCDIRFATDLAVPQSKRCLAIFFTNPEWCYTTCVSLLRSNQGYCNCWTQVEGLKGGNEIISCLVRVVTDHLPSLITNMWCIGQTIARAKTTTDTWW